MRWPLVSRGRYEDMKAARDEACRIAETWKQYFDSATEKHTVLVATVVHMRRDGFVAQIDPNEFIPAPPTVDETDEERALEEQRFG